MTTRPILDRVKQKLFDRIEADLQESRILDVFAGTGTLGFEALSRGAGSCVFIEQDHKAFQLLRENTEHLGVTDQTLCWRTNATTCSYKPRGVPDFMPFDVVFFDPPYPLAKKQLVAGTSLYKALGRLAGDEVTNPEISLLILRVPLRCEPEVPDEWIKTEFEINAASMRILFYEKTDD